MPSLFKNSNFLNKKLIFFVTNVTLYKNTKDLKEVKELFKIKSEF